MSFETDFAGMIADTLTFVSATLDETGELTATGASTSVSCYIQEETELVTDAGGKEIVSTVQVFAGLNSLTVNAHLYTLPSRFGVSANREAVAIEHVTDELGAYAETIMF